MQTSNKKSDCCPEFNPVPWVNVTPQLYKKLFIKDICQLKE